METMRPLSKRRRILSPHEHEHEHEHERRKNICDIALEPLTHVASFLPAPSRAMFAMALSPDWYDEAPGYARWIASPTERRVKITDKMKKIAGKCNVLDFGELDAEFAMSLSNDYVEDILLCLDREDNRIKRLRLTHCINVNGSFMRSLRRSTTTTIEQIDLSIVPEHVNPKEWEYQYDIKLSFYRTVDILDGRISIITL